MKSIKTLVILVISLFRVRQSDTSHGKEYAHLKSLTEDLKIKAGWAVGVAAADGVNYSSTLGFLKQGWAGLAVELHPTHFARLALF